MSKVTNTFSPATPAQNQFIESLAKKLGYRFASRAYEKHIGRAGVRGYTREHAAQLIDALKAEDEANKGK